MSYHGTVTCSHCYERGHNMRGCPKLKKEAAADPNGYAARKLTRMKPRTCTYCDETGHNRRGCPLLKSHKATFIADTHLWRRAFGKWMREQGANFGALLSAPIGWQDHTGEYHGRESNGYDGKPCVGMLKTFSSSSPDDADGLDHRQVRGGLRDRYMIGMEVVGGMPQRNGTTRILGLMLPDIPLLAPATGEDSWGYERTRTDDEAQWTVVSPSPLTTSYAPLESLAVAEQRAGTWFKSGKDAGTKSDFFALTAPQRKAIKEYLNDSATLDELHRRLNPSKDDNSESNND